jgi:hypothetical protein
MLGGRALRKNMFAVISAVFCGFLAVFIPLYVWHQVNFPNTSLTCANVRKEAMKDLESYGISPNDLSMAPFYVTLILSFLASLVAYVFSKRRV